VSDNDASDDWGDPWHGRHVDHDPPARVVWRDGGWRPATVIARTSRAGAPVGLWEVGLSPSDPYRYVKRAAAILFRRGLAPDQVLAKLRADLPARAWGHGGRGGVRMDTLSKWSERYGWRATARPHNGPTPGPRPESALLGAWRCCGQVRPGSCPACGRVSPLAPDTQ
jgi:hypothetical protein